jgi:two-component system NtrC family sensor kinase
MLHEHALRAFEAQDAALIATGALMRGRSWSEIVGSHSLHGVLVELDRATPSTAGVALIAPDGRLAAASRWVLPAPTFDLSTRDYVKVHKGSNPPVPTTPEGTFVGEVSPGAITGRPVFRLSRARVDAEGNADGGVISAAFFPSYFANFRRSIRASENDIVLLARHDGAILARHPIPRQPVGLRLRSSPLLEAMTSTLQGKEDLLRVEIEPPAKPRLVAFRRLREFPVSVAYAINPDVHRRDWLQRLLAPTRRQQSSVQDWRPSFAGPKQARRLAISRPASRMTSEMLLRSSPVARIIEAHAEDSIRVRHSAALMAGTADRAARLAARMLSFARRSGAASEAGAATQPLDLTTTLAEVADLLGATMGSGFKVRFETAQPAPPKVGVERGELEAALINLCDNARDAMQRGGAILIEASGDAVAFDEEHPQQLGTGAYARISVRDTGSGMDAATLARVGEPFFTTKPPGHGTGLGLSMARGFAVRAGGALHVGSELGKGTTVVIWLPAYRSWR